MKLIGKSIPAIPLHFMPDHKARANQVLRAMPEPQKPIKSFDNKFRFPVGEQIISLSILFAACAISYGVNISSLGFFGEDWHLIYLLHNKGVDYFISWLSGIRPGSGYTYLLGYYLWGFNPTWWHTGSVLLRIGAALFLFYSLQLILRKRIIISLLISLLFLLFPGYHQQFYLVMNWGLYFGLFLFTISYFLSLKALLAPNKLSFIILTLFACVFGYLSYYSYDQYFGLEIFRGASFLYMTRNRLEVNYATRKHLVWLWKKWFPYFFVWAAFFIWRFSLKATTDRMSASNKLEIITSNPYDSISHLANIFYQSMLNSVFLSWTVPLDKILAVSPMPISYPAVLLGAAFAIFITGYQLYHHKINAISLPETLAFKSSAAQLSALGFLAASLSLPVTGFLDGTTSATKALIGGSIYIIIIALYYIFTREIKYIWVKTVTIVCGSLAFLFACLPLRYAGFPDPFHNWVLIATFTGMLLCIVIIYWLHRRYSPPAAGHLKQWTYALMILGLLGCISGILMCNLGTLRPVLLSHRWDRYLLAATIGISLFFTMLTTLALPKKAGAILLGCLVGASISFQTLNAYKYEYKWADLKSILWNIKWRAPQLAKGTVLLCRFDQKENQDFKEYNIYGPLDFYYPGRNIAAFSLIPRLEGKIKSRDTVTQGAAKLKADFSKALLVYVEKNTCPRLLACDQIPLPPDSPPFIKKVSTYSDLGLVQSGGQLDPMMTEVFGHEPPHGWCYYFQKVELANQLGHGKQAARLAKEAIARGLTPRNQREWLPLALALARDGQDAQAKFLAELALAGWPDQQPFPANIVNELKRLGINRPVQTCDF